MKLVIIVCPPTVQQTRISALVCFIDNMRVLLISLIHGKVILLARVIKSYKFIWGDKVACRSAVSLSEQASSFSAKSGKTCKWGGRETCSILILHGWQILLNECELFSVPLFHLPIFSSSFKETPQSEVWAAVDTCPTAPPHEKRSHLFQVWITGFEFPRRAGCR